MEKTKSKITPKKIINVSITVVLAVAFLFALVCLCYVSIQMLKGQEVNLFGLKLYYVETDSMSPTIEKGNMILSKVIENTDDYKSVDEQINVGDIVTFKQTINGYVINNTHRVIKDVYFDESKNCYCIQTKGDNPHSTKDAPLPISNLRAKMVTKMASLGDVYGFLGSTAGIATMIIVPMALILIISIYQLVMKIKEPAKKEKQVVLSDEEKEKLRKEKEEEIAKKAVEDYIYAEKRKKEIAEQAVREYIERNKDKKD